MMLQFPERFLWGVATAAFQIEGASAVDGKGPSIWDVFCAIPGKTARGETGAVACDHYQRYLADVELMRRLNLRAYRFSVSWPRVLPQGRGAVNAAGLAFYERLVDALLAAGIEPMITLYHWDLPAALQMELGGWAHADLPKIFADYARLIFDRLGDRVRYWLTLNEPWCAARMGHVDGCHAPGARNEALGYLVAHNLLRAHAYAVAELRNSSATGQHVSIALNTDYSFPASERPADVAAAERATQAFAGWFGDPVTRGDYPPVMRERLGMLLPRFTDEDQRLLANSIDYLGLNYYFPQLVRHAPGSGPFEIELVQEKDGARTAMGWPVRPDGLYHLLRWASARYPGLPIHITENGMACAEQPDAHGYVDDPARIAYLRDHLAAAHTALSEGIDLRGYFVWSLYDNLEWAHGFSKRFGLVRCDFETLARTVKASGHWYARCCAEGRVDLGG
jgi:beta-glucosidase